MSAALIAAHPAWIGENTAIPSAGTSTTTTSTTTTPTTTTPTTTTPTATSAAPKPLPAAGQAAPISLPVAAGTVVDAVTTGQITSVSAEQTDGQGPSPDNAVVLAGSDGATYLYTDVTTPRVKVGTKVTPGQPIGLAGATGITFAITVPDVAHQVDADDALQAWSLGTTDDVHALSVTTTPAANPTGTATATQNLLVATDSATGSTGPQLAHLLSGKKVKTSTLTLDVSATPASQAASILSAATVTPAVAATATTPAKPAVLSNLVVVSLADSSPSQTSAILAALPASLQVLWVAAPAATPATEAAASPATKAAAAAVAYQSVLVAHPNLRVESMPSGLDAVTAGMSASATPAPTTAAPSTTPPTWSSVGSEVVSSLVSSYAASAYQLPLANAAVSAVLAYGEAQIGKPYQWAGAGPATFDCSGLVMQAFRQVGLDFVHNAYAQYEATKAEQVSAADLQPGDLV
ncbi:MAG TPA: NlpC/P60 family protein, partial [Acidimicrobiales bacterium]